MRNQSILTPNDTIAALATAEGRGALRLIRISGPDAFVKALALFSWPKEFRPQHRHCYYRAILKDSGAILDDVMVTFFYGPHSFTGEDTVELCCHGGSYISKEILSLLYAKGCRAANPGEFTQRAYMHGKMDLTAAEGIRELVDSQTHEQWLAARQLAEGKLSQLIHSLRSQLLKASAFLEARIDFPDEEEARHVAAETVKSASKEVLNTIRDLRSTFSSGRIARDGLRVAIMGPPNAGKSTLLNVLLDEERAIVSPVPGTTRDYIEESCIVDGRLVRFVDTAGIRETKDRIEQAGIERTLKIAKESDVILLLIPADDLSLLDQWKAKLSSLDHSNNKIFIIQTKSDLQGHPSKSIAFDLCISCKEDKGISDLKKLFIRDYDNRIEAIKPKPFITDARHDHALAKAEEALERIIESAGFGIDDECLAFEMQEALRSLSVITGTVSPDDILSEIFSTFCIGK